MRCLSPRSGPGQTLIRSDNHGVPPKGMNCNFLFRGINCRPCRSLGWIRPRSPSPLFSASAAGFAISLLSVCLSPPISLLLLFLFFMRPFCCFVSLCIYVSYLFIYLKHCALLLLYFNMFFHPLHCASACTACGHVHIAPSWAVPASFEV